MFSMQVNCFSQSRLISALTLWLPLPIPFPLHLHAIPESIVCFFSLYLQTPWPSLLVHQLCFFFCLCWTPKQQYSPNFSSHCFSHLALSVFLRVYIYFQGFSNLYSQLVTPKSKSKVTIHQWYYVSITSVAILAWLKMLRLQSTHYPIYYSNFIFSLGAKQFAKTLNNTMFQFCICFCILQFENKAPVNAGFQYDL